MIMIIIDYKTIECVEIGEFVFIHQYLIGGNMYISGWSCQ